MPLKKIKNNIIFLKIAGRGQEITNEFNIMCYKFLLFVQLADCEVHIMFTPEYVLFHIICEVTSGQHEWLAKKKHDLWWVLITFQRKFRNIFNFARAVNFLEYKQNILL